MPCAASDWSYYRPHLFTDVKRWEGRRLLYAGRRRTKFGELLAASRWLADKGGTPRRPSELFLDTPRTREVLGDDVPFLAVEFQDQRVVEDLDINKGPTVDAALARLREFAGRQAADVGVVRTLYQFLDQQFDSQATAIAAAFSSNPLCLTTCSPASFLPSGQVFWQDPGPAFLSRRGFLSGQWPELKAFFVRKLGVAVSPSPEDYAAVLRELGSSQTIAVERDEGHPLVLQLSSLGLPGSNSRHAIALVVDPDRQADVSAEVLASLFGCTSAEARLAAALVAGKRLEEIGEEFGVKQTTITYHLQNLFQKTHTHRQADLVALLIRATIPLSLGT